MLSLVGRAAAQDESPDELSSPEEACQGCSSGWVVGALINLCGSVCINLGVNLIKQGHERMAKAVEEAEASGQEPPKVTQFRHWQVGVVFFAVGNVCNFGSFAFAAQSLLAALGCVQFVSNVVFARYINGEKATWLQIGGTMCIVAGTVLTVLFGVHSSKTYDSDDLMHLYEKPVYLVYAGVQLCMCVAAYCIYHRGHAIAEGKILTGGGSMPAFYRAVTPFAYAVYSGMIGTNSLLFSKMVSSILAELFSGNVDQLTNWFTWLVLVLLVATAVFWIAQQNKGLRMFDALVIVPALQMVWTSTGILTGLFFFEEYKDLVDHAPDKWLGLWEPGPSDDGFTAQTCTALFICGMLCILCGAVLLAPRSETDAIDAEKDTEQTAPLLTDQASPTSLRTRSLLHTGMFVEPRVRVGTAGTDDPARLLVGNASANSLQGGVPGLLSDDQRAGSALGTQGAGGTSFVSALQAKQQTSSFATARRHPSTIWESIHASVQDVAANIREAVDLSIGVSRRSSSRFLQGSFSNNTSMMSGIPVRMSRTPFSPGSPPRNPSQTCPPGMPDRGSSAVLASTVTFRTPLGGAPGTFGSTFGADTPRDGKRPPLRRGSTPKGADSLSPARHLSPAPGGRQDFGAASSATIPARPPETYSGRRRSSSAEVLPGVGQFDPAGQVDPAGQQLTGTPALPGPPPGHSQVDQSLLSTSTGRSFSS
eukprot:TRINITY_DN3589_c0_g1_i2.p1 TRINITY_DN3589_c0_g1~~TRINITY_DN3589_c0_g1_i2.p1  ORF type:complete len:732 (+),score=208.43 TRINITY_DN3589_c0_g1_i2:79-2196(+)